MPPATRRTRTPVEQPLVDVMDDKTEMAAAIADVVPLYQRRIEIEYWGITDIVPYEWNPRQNEKAVAAVKASIATFGFLVPCVIDGNGVLVAGHTRVEASKELGITDVPCIRADHLTPEQINAFRLIDNKVAEQAEWDFDLLAGEINKLGELNIDWVQFGWSQDEIDCLSELVSADCLNPATLVQEAGNSENVEPAQRRAPLQTRVVIGEVVFFVPAQQYRNWIDGVRQMHDYNEEAIATDLRRRLGILE